MSHINIEVANVTFSYDGTRNIIDNMSFVASEHDSIGLIGANGAGKSTFLKLLVGLEWPSQGEIRVEHIPITKDTLPKVRERIGYVFQDAESQLFMTNVYDDVAFAPRNYGLSEVEVEERVNEALMRTHTEHLRNKAIYKLSGGEKKLVSIATVLSLLPDIIIMDEPESSLDPRNRRALINILNEFHHLKIITSHDLDFIWDTCSRAILLNDGKIVYDGPTDHLMTNRELLEANGMEPPLSLSRI